MGIMLKIFDHMESRAFGMQGDSEASAYRTFPTLRNNVFAYPAWGIALARVPTDGPHGMEKELAPITRMVDRTFFKEYQLPYKRGILLYGKPGNGKTTLVKSIAGSVKAPVAYWQITENTCSDSIQEVFQAAANLAPMILVIEDIDAMPQRARSYFLNILDGATSKEGIFLIGTTNYPEQIDPALMNRAGRFDALLKSSFLILR
jgi:hypothetical protein